MRKDDGHHFLKLEKNMSKMVQESQHINLKFVKHYQKTKDVFNYLTYLTHLQDLREMQILTKGISRAFSIRTIFTVSPPY